MHLLQNGFYLLSMDAIDQHIVIITLLNAITI